MRIKLKLFLLLGILLVDGCSKDAISNNEEDSIIPSFIVIGEDLDFAYEYRYNGLTDKGEIKSLSEELGVFSDYLTLRQSETSLAFYSFSSGSFSLARKNIISGNSERFQNFYTNTGERSILWGINTENTVFFGFYAPVGTANLGILAVDLNGVLVEEFILENNILNLYQPLYGNGKLFITFRDSMGNYKIVVFNTNTRQVVKTLQFEKAAPAILFDDFGDLAVVRPVVGLDAALEVYDFNTLEIKKQFPITLNQTFVAGPLSGILNNNKLYYSYAYSQPFSLSSGPAVLDIAQNSNVIIDLLSLVDNLESELGKTIIPISQGYSKFQNVFFVGYGILNNGERVEGGVLIISASGELLKNIAIPFAPTYFVKD